MYVCGAFALQVIDIYVSPNTVVQALQYFKVVHSLPQKHCPNPIAKLKTPADSLQASIIFNGDIENVPVTLQQTTFGQVISQIG